MIVRALVVALLLIIPSVAHADVIGPVCWVMEAFPNEPFRLFFIVDPANPNVASVVGRNPLTQLPLTGSAIVFGQPPNSVQMVLIKGQPTPASTAVVITVDFDLANLLGLAVCQGVNAAVGGCGTGLATNWNPVPCP